MFLSIDLFIGSVLSLHISQRLWHGCFQMSHFPLIFILFLYVTAFGVYARQTKERGQGSLVNVEFLQKEQVK